MNKSNSDVEFMDIEELRDTLNKMSQEEQEKLYKSMDRIRYLMIKLPEYVDDFNTMVQHINETSRYLRLDGPKCLTPISKYELMGLSEEKVVENMLKDIKKMLKERPCE